MTVQIHSPVEGYTGHTYIGPLSLDFQDGTAEHDGDLSAGARAYLEAQGYGIDAPARRLEQSPPEPLDPRQVEVEQVGAHLRDAAVEPQAEDFLPPTNAGQDNPHGPSVVAPGIHAVETLPVAPGEVSSDADEQQAKETALADDVLVQQRDVGDATRAVAGEADKPKGNASREAWAEYALQHGADEQLVADMTRDELRAFFSA